MMNRIEPQRMSDERTMLTEMLDYCRATSMLKIGGLTDVQARARSAPPSDLDLLGLVRQVADVERSWFRERFAGEALPPLFDGQTDPGADPDLDLHPGPADLLRPRRVRQRRPAERIDGATGD